MIEMIVEGTGKGETEGEGEPHPHQASVQADAEEISQRQRHNEIREKGHKHHRPDISQSAHGIAEGTLQAIAELINDQRNDGIRHLCRDHRRTGEKVPHALAEDNHRYRHEDSDHEVEMASCPCRTPNGCVVVLSMEMADADRHRRGERIIELEEELTDGKHNLMTGQRIGPYPSHDDAAQRPGATFHTHLQADRRSQGDERAHLATAHPALPARLPLGTMTPREGEA